MQTYSYVLMAINLLITIYAIKENKAGLAAFNAVPFGMNLSQTITYVLHS